MINNDVTTQQGVRYLRKPFYVSHASHGELWRIVIRITWCARIPNNLLSSYIMIKIDIVKKMKIFLKKYRIIFLFLPFLIVPLILLFQNNEGSLIEQLGEDKYLILIAFLIILFFVTNFGFVLKSIYDLFFSVYRIFWGKGKKAAKIIQSGQKGFATLISLTETKGGILSINEQPVLTMTLAIENHKSEIYNVSFDVIVPQTELPNLLPGLRFPVFIDPSNKNIIVVNKQGLTELYQPVAVSGKLSDADKTEITKYGLPALANLKSVDDTGRSVHFQSVVKLVYEIQIEGETSYQVETEMGLREKTALKLRSLTDTSFAARVHPYDRNKVIIDLMKLYEK